ncbi:MAG: hypothetical protein ABIJ31_15840 [Pseudomonadota bacterium]
MAIINNIPSTQSRPKPIGLFWILIIGLFFSELLAYTCVRTETTQMLFNISQAQEMLTQEQSYQKSLMVERDRLKSDDRITRIAKTRLNLSGNTSAQTIYWTGDTK